MDSIRYKGLYGGCLEGVKQTRANQYMAKCPFHSDKNPSFTFNDTDGLYFCFAGCGGGNAYQFAERMNLPNPHQYINGSNFTEPPKIEPVPDYQFISKFVDDATKDLKPEHIPSCWDLNLAREMGVGYANGKLQFAHHDINGNIIAVHEHRGKVMGVRESKWYMIHKLKDYDINKPIYIAEGEKDAITLLSQGFQVVSNTTGCQSIPKGKDGFYDLSFLKPFKEIYIAYDNDDAGRKGAQRLGTEIISKAPYPSVKIIQWNKQHPKGYDVTDAYSIDDEVKGHPFLNACMDAKEIKLPKVEYPSFEVFTDVEAESTPLKESVQLIEHILIKDSFQVFGGTAGCNKTMFWMQVGMALANDEDEVMGFKINKKGLKVAYIDTECGSAEVKRRFKKMKLNFTNWKSTGRFIMMSRKSKMISEALDDIEQFIQIHRPDVVIFDCLYNMKKGTDLAKNHNISPITDRDRKSVV